MNPETGSFISRDTYSGDYNSPITLHKYLYANANPITYSDPSGYMAAVAEMRYNVGVASFGISLINKVLSIVAKNFFTVATITAVSSLLLDNVLSHIILGNNGISQEVRDGIIAGTAGSIALAIPYTETQQQTRAKEADIKQRRKNGDTLIFRGGSGTYNSVTPRAIDINGLSCYLSAPSSGKYLVTTVNIVNATGVLIAIVDGVNHASVLPKNTGTMAEWIATKETADEHPHPYSVLFRSICIGPFKGVFNIGE